jgi:hypothetical protein
VQYRYGETVTVRTVTVTGQDSDGNDVRTSTAETVLWNVPVWDPRFGNAEATQGQDVVTSDVALWLPLSVAVAATDRLLVRGDEYEVDGNPAIFLNPYNGISGQQINANRVTG